MSASSPCATTTLACPGRVDSAQSTSAVPTVLHIEDDHLWAEVTADLLKAWPEVCHVGTAPCGREGIALCREKQPAIVILDLGLPDIDGLAVLMQLNALLRPPLVLLLTGRADEAFLYRLGTGDIAGLVWKRVGFADHLRPALAAVAGGGGYFPPEVREAIRRFRRSPDAFFKILSPSEQHLVSLTDLGCTDAEIARCTGRCPSTVRVHFHNLMVKLQLKDRHELLHWARARGLLTGCNRIRCEAWGKLAKSSPVSKPDV